ncbi:MAG: hypothetical protein IJG82_09480 [Atopobiaceae bacterium]|nr:hypothetical protein [Atopobiaceae bacterium]
MQRERFMTWLNTERRRYVDAISGPDSYNRGWEKGYMYAMRKALAEYEKDEGPVDSSKMRMLRHGGAFVTRYADGSVGLFLEPSSVSAFTEALDDMASMYADEGRDNWWEADDIARSVAEEMRDMLS